MMLQNVSNCDVCLSWGQYNYSVPANGVGEIKPDVARAMLVRFPEALKALGEDLGAKPPTIVYPGEEEEVAVEVAPVEVVESGEEEATPAPKRRHRKKSESEGE